MFYISKHLGVLKEAGWNESFDKLAESLR